MKRIKAALLTAAVVAGMTVAATPAQAVDYCNIGGGTIICEYGVSTTTLPDGTKQEFAIGTDRAVWTRWTKSGGWTSWTSMGGEWYSSVGIRTQQVYPYLFALVLKGSDGWLWANWRDSGGNWTGWSHLPDPT
ncbi:hypothetical protein ABZ776_02700 [Streptomyces sp. NPDC007076]|jgi:hypothetical protein|uniref:PLL-like beta propeller domain-containing protein n=1 Tax=Streptomyces pulveraceus TaxID=68258 RepID=A0ABW1GC77_9ACTN|nr:MULTISPECIES: hypothetical protein [unclassified Streptomyces]MEE1842916.1 hypothetical protein [Streptomyces sp. JV190]MYQ83364.1 hypothetical protein [Streptomyces sp. SID4936]SCD65054.1 hypothetical protein GA0115234_1041174 [Streptomyces sp. DvalAA-43]